MLAIDEHPSFDRPPVTTRLWRYTDFAKFIDLLVSSRLWLANAELLASDDPYEGVLGAVRFPHRMWRCFADAPELLQNQIMDIYNRQGDVTPDPAFLSWFMVEEQQCIMMQAGRRDYYVNCWHAADYESVAMWKIYGTQGGGVAIITNGARLEVSLQVNEQSLHLGAIRYRDSYFVQIGNSNAFDTIMVKRASYDYEREVRLVHWDTTDLHDTLANFEWDNAVMRFGNFIDNPTPIKSGLSFSCDVDVMIEKVIISPFAPPWYAGLIEQIRDRLGYAFPVHRSKLLQTPPILP